MATGSHLLYNMGWVLAPSTSSPSLPYSGMDWAQSPPLSSWTDTTASDFQSNAYHQETGAGLGISSIGKALDSRTTTTTHTASLNFDHALPDSPLPDICQTWLSAECAYTTAGYYNAPKMPPVWGYRSHSGYHSLDASTTTFPPAMDSYRDSGYHFAYLKETGVNTTVQEMPMCVDPADLTGPSKNVTTKSEELAFEIFNDSGVSSLGIDAFPTCSQELSYPEAVNPPPNGLPSTIPIDESRTDLSFLPARGVVAQPHGLKEYLSSSVLVVHPVCDDDSRCSPSVTNPATDPAQASTSLLEFQSPTNLPNPQVKKEEGEFLWPNIHISCLGPMPRILDNELPKPTLNVKIEPRPSTIDLPRPAWSAHGGIELEVLLSYFASYMAQNLGPDINKQWLLSFAGKLSPGGEKLPEYRCYVNGCTQRNKRRDHILTHLNSHLDYRPFRCQHCPANFLRKNELKRHELSHTGVRPHVCPICSVAFNRRDLWKRHLKRRHDVDPGKGSYN